MRNLRSEDVLTHAPNLIFSVARPDAWAKQLPSDLPFDGEVVCIDGRQHVVDKTMRMHGMGSYQKHYLIYTQTPCS